MEKLLVPIEISEIRSSQTEKGRHIIKGKAKITPGKAYTYNFKLDSEGKPLVSLKEVFSTAAWDKIKKKILAKDVFIDVNHKTVAELEIKRKLNELSRETGKDLKEFQKSIEKWVKISEMPLFKMEEANLNNESIELSMSMNPYFRDIDNEHAAYYDSILGSVKEGYLNSISLNFNPTGIDRMFNPDTGEYIPKINDIDVYGISLVHNAGHDDMQDVLDIAIRMAQNVTEESKMQEEKQQIVKDLKEQVKKEISEDAIKAENEKLKAQIAEKETLLKAKEDADKKAKIDAMIAENEKLKADIKRRDDELQSGSRGFVPPPPSSNFDERKRVQDLLDTVKSSRSPFGKMIQLQADLKSINTLPEETRRFAMDKNCDIRVDSKGQILN